MDEIPNLNDMAFLVSQMSILSSQDEKGLRTIAKLADQHAIALHNVMRGLRRSDDEKAVLAATDFLRKLATPGTIG